MPVAEAMASGIPVIYSNVSSIPKVGGDAVLTFDPYNAEQLADKMFMPIDEPDLRNQMIEKGYERVKPFDRKTMVQNTLNVFKEVLER